MSRSPASSPAVRWAAPVLGRRLRPHAPALRHLPGEHLGRQGRVHLAEPRGRLLGRRVPRRATGTRRAARHLHPVEQSKDDFAARAKIVGTMRWNDQHQIVTEFDELPQLPFGEFRLTLRGGDHGVLTTPRACGTYEGRSSLQPSNGAAPVTTPLPITIDQDCIDPAALPRTIGVTTSTTQAGAAGAVTTISIVRPDRQARLAHLDADLPRACSPISTAWRPAATPSSRLQPAPRSSRIGGVRATVGVGSAPLTSGGDVFLMDPPAGAAAGVGIQAPVKFGDVDLGMLAMTARIDLRQSDFGLRFSADVPIATAASRSRSASSTSPWIVPASGRTPPPAIRSRRGARCDPISASPRTSRCPFATTAAAASRSPRRSPRSSPGTSPSPAARDVNVRLELPGGNAAIRRAKVTLPRPGHRSRGAQRACAEDTWIAGQWRPERGRRAGRGSVAILPSAARARLARQGARQRAPRHRRAVHGALRLSDRRAAQRLQDRRAAAEFPTVPDVPLTRMDLTFLSGSAGRSR